MKLVCLSDTHGVPRQLDMAKYKGDVLIFAGDWTSGRDIGLAETEDFLDWVDEQPYKHKVIIAGNHEVTVERYKESFDILIKDYPGIIYLNNESTAIDGIKFYGSPYSNEFYNWAFMEEELALSKIWDKIPDDTNVLITHGPAYGCNDLVKNSYSRDPHVGSQSLSYRKKELKDLKVHISGHIHEAYGISATGDAINVCPCILNEKYQLTNKPIIVEV